MPFGRRSYLFLAHVDGNLAGSMGLDRKMDREEGTGRAWSRWRRQRRDDRVSVRNGVDNEDAITSIEGRPSLPIIFITFNICI